MKPFLHRTIIGNGPPLVMLHGWGWHSGVWQPIVSDLTKHNTIYLIDLPGCGNSADLLDAYTIEHIASLLVESVPDDATWLGWSLGGMISWWIAVFYPYKVKNLITVCSSPHFIAKANWPGVSEAVLEKFSVTLIENTEQTLLDFLKLQLLGQQNNSALFSQIQEIIKTNPSPTLPALLGGLAILRTLDLRSYSLQISGKRIHIFGEMDALVPRKVASLISSDQAITLSIKKAGHLPFLSHSDEFLKIIHDQLNGEENNS